MTSFSERRQALFDVLQAAEDSNVSKRRKCVSSRRESVKDSSQSLSALRSQTKPYRFKKSMFLRSEDPISKCLGVRSIPDYHKNPHKWTHYSLEDVPDVTDRSNARAAAICLQEIRRSKETSTVEEDGDDDSKVVFKLPIKIPSARDTQTKLTYKSSKVIMPEYEVGKSAKNKNDALEKKTKRTTDNANGIQLKLDHLLYDDES